MPGIDPSQAAPAPNTALDGAADAGTTPLNPQMGQADPNAPPAAPAAAAGPQKPSMWKSVLMGALHGLAEGGLPGAALGAAMPTDTNQAWDQRKQLHQSKVDQAHAQTQEMQNTAANTAAQTAHTKQLTAGLPAEQASAAQAAADAHTTAGLSQAEKAQTLGLTAQFQDAQAANAVAMDSQNYDNTQKLPPAAKAAQYATNNSLNDFLKQLGVPPIAISDDDHDSVVSTLNAIGKNNPNGVIPHLLNVDVNGQHVSYDLNQLAGSPQALAKINAKERATGVTPTTPSQWAQTPPAARTNALEKAADFFAPPAPKSAMEAKGTYLQYQSTLDAYEKTPNPDPQVLSGLQGLTKQLKTKADAMQAAEKDLNASKAYSNAYGQTMGRNDANNSNYQDLANGDVTGWKPRDGMTMTGQQFNQANNKFVNSRLDTTLQTDSAYQKFQDAKKAYMAGDDKTGASSMQALFAHIQTTTAGLKGMRQTSDIIHEHQNAIGLQDKAARFMDRLKTGQALSANQWDEFGKLIKTARDQSWDNAITEAHAAGVPITKDMKVPSDILSKYTGQSTANKHSDIGFVPMKGN